MQTKSLFIIITFIATLFPVASADSFHKDLLKAADTKSSGEYVRFRFLQMMNKPFNSTGKKKALIIGDSHAQDFLNSVLENGYLQDYQISTRYIPVRCQISLDGNNSNFISKKDSRFCEKADSLSKAKQQIAEADLVILAAYWKEWSAKELPQTIDNLNLNPQQKLFIIGRKSYGKISVRNYLRMPKEKLRHLRTQVDNHQHTVNSLMRRTLSSSVFIDQHALICNSPDDCPVFTDQVELISYDGGHLTKAGARYVGKLLFAGSPLGNL